MQHSKCINFCDQRIESEDVEWQCSLALLASKLSTQKLMLTFKHTQHQAQKHIDYINQQSLQVTEHSQNFLLCPQHQLFLVKINWAFRFHASRDLAAQHRRTSKLTKKFNLMKKTIKNYIKIRWSSRYYYSKSIKTSKILLKVYVS